MKLLNYFVISLLLGLVVTACSGDEPTPVPDNPDQPETVDPDDPDQPDDDVKPLVGRAVTIVDDVASDGATFRRIDENLYIIGDLKYEIKDDHMELVGYADGVTLTDVKPYAHVTYKDVRYDVTKIGSFAFSKCATLKSFDIPATVTTMGPGVFSGCTALTEFPDLSTVSEIGGSCFNGCTALTEVNWPSVGLKTIPDFTFEGCTALKSLSLPGVTTINRLVFNGCTALESVDLPDVFYIGDYAFEGCSSLTKVSAPACYEVRGFSKCESLEEIYLPNCNNVHLEAFAYDLKLRKVVLPKCVKIYDRAFVSSPNIEVLEVPNLEALWTGTWARNKVQQISLPECKTVETWPFELVQEINLPGCVTVGNLGFQACKARSISLPACETISGKAFNDCTALKEIRIGNACYKMESDLFKGTTTLTDMYIETLQPPVAASETFASLPAGCVLHVRAAALANYMADPVWTTAFASIVGDL